MELRLVKDGLTATFVFEQEHLAKDLIAQLFLGGSSVVEPSVEPVEDICLDELSDLANSVESMLGAMGEVEEKKKCRPKTSKKIREQQVLDLYAEGKRIRYIASLLRISPSTVSTILKNNKVKLRRNKFSSKCKVSNELLACLYTEGYTSRQLVEIADIDDRNIRRHLLAVGCKTRPKSCSRPDPKLKPIGERYQELLAEAMQKPSYEDAVVAKMYKDGASIQNIADAYNMSFNRIRNILLANNVKLRCKGVYSKITVATNDLITLYYEGYTTTMLGVLAGITNKNISRRLLLAGCKMRSSGRTRKENRKNLKPIEERYQELLLKQQELIEIQKKIEPYFNLTTATNS